jgi:hypothetical protein
MRKLLIKFPSQIRISGWDFGSSARAMNQAGGKVSTQAELVKVTNSTTERKSMSTKTSIKRIALVAVSALGFGLLSVVPSNAVVSGALTVTTAAGSGSITAGTSYETATAATISVSGLITSTLDSVTVSVVQKSAPTGSSAVKFKLAFIETTTSAVSQIERNGITGTSLTTVANGTKNTASAVYDSTTAFTTGQSNYYNIYGTGAGYIGAKVGLLADTSTAAARVAGDYVFTAIIQTYSGGALSNTQVADVTYTINDTDAAIALANGTISSALSTAYLNSGSSVSTNSDSSVAVVATAATTDHAAIRVRTYTADGLAAPESVTATVTGPGVVCNGGVCGKSLTITGAGGDNTFTIHADGTAGVASIVIATTTKTFAAKKVTFYAKAAKTISAVVNKAVISASSNSSVVYADIKDANGAVWAGTAYIYATSAASALIAGSETPAACTYNSTTGLHACSVTGKTIGTASFKVIDASTVALSNVSSDAVSVTVSAAAAAKVSLSFDKATYAPGERAVIWAKVVDADGKAIPTATLSNLFATGAIKSNVALTAVSSNVLTSVSGTVADATDTTTDPNNPTYAGAVAYVVTMPLSSGEVVLTATGGTSLEAAGRVAVTASAEVVNESVTAAVDAANEATDAANAATDAANAAAEAADAATAAAQDAQAAVAALATSVSSLIAGIKAQITSLTNLVIKIQKKVKA